MLCDNKNRLLNIFHNSLLDLCVRPSLMLGWWLIIGLQMINGIPKDNLYDSHCIINNLLLSSFSDDCITICINRSMLFNPILIKKIVHQGINNLSNIFWKLFEVEIIIITNYYNSSANVYVIICNTFCFNYFAI